MVYWWRAVGFCVLTLLIGCTHTPTVELGQFSRESVELSDVPFFAQRRNQCGAAALATVLVHKGVKTSAVELEPFVYLPEREGALNLELVGQVRRHGLLAIPVNTIDGVLKEVANGNPVLVMQNLGLDWLPQWHFAVVVGFNPESQQLILRSANNPKRTVHVDAFMETWGRADFWGIVASYPDYIPMSTTADVFIKEAVAMEYVGQVEVARKAYMTAYKHWPSADTYLAQLGLANIAYARNEKDEAKKWFIEAIQHHPKKALVWNNLAFLMMDFGCYPQAQKVMSCALNLFPDHPTLVASQQEINEAVNAKLITGNQHSDGDRCYVPACP